MQEGEKQTQHCLLWSLDCQSLSMLLLVRRREGDGCESLLPDVVGVEGGSRVVHYLGLMSAWTPIFVSQRFSRCEVWMVVEGWKEQQTRADYEMSNMRSRADKSRHFK